MDFPKHTGTCSNIVLLGCTLHCVLDWIYFNKYFRKCTVEIFDKVTTPSFACQN